MLYMCMEIDTCRRCKDRKILLGEGRSSLLVLHTVHTEP
jgi:hypothetical protein